MSYSKRYALGTLFKDCACKYVSQPCLNMLSGLFFFLLSPAYILNAVNCLSAKLVHAHRSSPLVFHLFYFLEGGVSSGHFSLYFYFQDILLPVWLHIAAMEDAAPSTSPEFHFRQGLSSSIYYLLLFHFIQGLCSATLIHTPKKHIDENRDGMSAAARLPARRFWLWKTNTTRRTQ